MQSSWVHHIIKAAPETTPSRSSFMRTEARGEQGYHERSSTASGMVGDNRQEYIQTPCNGFRITAQDTWCLGGGEGRWVDSGEKEVSGSPGYSTTAQLWKLKIYNLKYRERSQRSRKKQAIKICFQFAFKNVHTCSWSSAMSFDNGTQ